MSAASPAVKHPEVLHPGSGSVDVVGGQVWFTEHQGSVKQLEGPHVHLNVKEDIADIRRTKGVSGARRHLSKALEQCCEMSLRCLAPLCLQLPHEMGCVPCLSCTETALCQ